MWGDIPAKGWRIHPRPEAVAFCCRGKNGYFCRMASFHLKFRLFFSFQFRAYPFN